MNKSVSHTLPLLRAQEIVGSEIKPPNQDRVYNDLPLGQPYFRPVALLSVSLGLICITTYQLPVLLRFSVSGPFIRRS
jgi:hypothetical protein